MTGPTFVIGVDAGASKTAARLERLADGARWESRHGPASLTHDPGGACTTIKDCVQDLCKQGDASIAETALVVGIAGYGRRDRVQILADCLGNAFWKLEITSDARTSLYGAALGAPAVVLALGTGSVAMRLDEGEERQFGGWGFAIGDEGSGAWIGKQAVRASLRELDGDGLPSSLLARQVCQRIGADRDSALRWIAHAGARDYARMATWVAEHARDCAMAREIMHHAAEEVARLIALARSGRVLPVYLVGGLAGSIMPYLDRELATGIRSPLGNSVDGACYLARQATITSSSPPKSNN